MLEEYFQKQEVQVSNISSLYGKASINLHKKPRIDVLCKNCDEGGNKNIQIKINTTPYWVSLDMLKIRKAYIFNSSAYAYKTSLSTSIVSQSIVTDYGKDELFSDIKNISFYQTNKTLAKGDILKVKDMVPVTLVKYGKSVKVHFNNGAIKLRLNGIARGSGSFGQSVDVFNPSSKKTLNAKIIDINTVVVDI